MTSDYSTAHRRNIICPWGPRGLWPILVSTGSSQGSVRFFIVCTFILDFQESSCLSTIERRLWGSS